MDSPQQKFFISDDGKEKVSITKAELQAGIDSGKHGEKTLAWTKEMSEWLPLADPFWEKHGIVIEQEPPELPNPIEDKTPQSASESNPNIEAKPFSKFEKTDFSFFSNLKNGFVLFSNLKKTNFSFFQI